MQIKPSKEEFIKLSERANLIALSTEINMDMDTPVSVYAKLVEGSRGYILESVDTTHQQFGRYSFIGAEPFARLQVFKERLMVQQDDVMRCINGEPVSALKEFMAGFKPLLADELPLVNGGLVGYFNYEIAAVFDRVRGLEIGENEILGQFMICRLLVVFDALKNSARLVYLAEAEGRHPEAAYDEAAVRMEEAVKCLAGPVPKARAEEKPPQEKLDLQHLYGRAPQDFLEAIHQAKEHIFAGDIFQVVPSRQFRVPITKPCFRFYRRLRQVNPSPYMFYLDFGPVKLVGASPEMLVKVAGKNIYTYPIAGTRRRGGSLQEDEALSVELKADEKECAEHSMLVDLARNDLGRISEAGTVRVTKLQEIEYFSHVMHMVSEVQGSLRDEYAPMDVLRATFPAGTVSGAPKLRAMEIINELEPARRGSYSGTVGYMDFAGNMDMCITLRTMRIEKDKEAVIQSGAGIVADSVPEKEYQEILQKSKALFEVVEEVENGDTYFR